MNVNTGQIYESLNEAKADAKDGETVIPIRNQLTEKQFQEMKEIGSTYASDEQFEEAITNLSEEDLQNVLTRMMEVKKRARIVREREDRQKKIVKKRRVKNKIRKASRKKNRKKNRK
jgi:hypothetical protein